MEEATILEKVWGPLFDKDGYPTVRLSQLLRGLAMHIVYSNSFYKMQTIFTSMGQIEDYRPYNSMVISPEKMSAYYKNARVVDDIYPWSSLFLFLLSIHYPSNVIRQIFSRSDHRYLKCIEA